MSQPETIQRIEAYFAAFNASDYDGLLSLLDEDVIHDINQGQREIGREKFSWFLARARQHYQESVHDIVIMTAPDGSRAAAEFTVRGTYLSTAEGLPEAQGQSYSISAGIFFELDGGRISRISSYYNLSEWIRQVEQETGV